MAGKKAAANGKSAGQEKASWIGFANVELMPEHRAVLKHYDLEMDEFFDQIAALLVSGHKMTYSVDAKNTAVQCSITGHTVDCPNAGYTMTSQGASVYQATLVALYKHNVIAGGKWSDVTVSPDDVMR